MFGKALRPCEKLYLPTPKEATGATEAPSGEGLAAGAGLAGGFCSGVCAKTGESGPPASRPASRIATRDRTHAEAVLMSLWLTPDRFEVPLCVFVIIITPRDSVPSGRYLI